VKRIKGLYIEDEPDNIATYSRFFRREEIDIVYLEQLFDLPSEYYEYICENEIDFVIIDNHLDKSGRTYDGFDVLKEIRKQDSIIYILLLTNFDYSNKGHDELGEFDQTIDKLEFKDSVKEIIDRIKRAHARRLSYEMSEDIKDTLDMKHKFLNENINELKKINDNLEKLISSKPCE
jgi:response regulator RpfG family c-di-GMP phosphodiesterase